MKTIVIDRWWPGGNRLLDSVDLLMDRNDLLLPIAFGGRYVAVVAFDLAIVANRHVGGLCARNIGQVIALALGKAGSRFVRF